MAMTTDNPLIDAALRGWKSNIERAGNLFGTLSPDQLEQQVSVATVLIRVLLLRQVSECVQEVSVHAHALRRSLRRDETFEVPLDFVADELTTVAHRRDRALALLGILAKALEFTLR